MNRKLIGMAATAFAFCSILSCSDKSSEITGIALNDSAVGEARVAAVAVKPSTVTDLQASLIGSTSVTLSFAQVNDGTGQPAKYDVRYAVAPISWGSATYATSGTCTTPIAGTTIGSQLSCTVLGLTPATNYNFQLVAFRGTLNLNAVFGSLSNVVSGATTASEPPPPDPVASVSVSPASSNLLIGATVQLLVTARDANDSVLTGRVVTSSSADGTIASVNSLGLVSAVSVGGTQITVTSEGKTAIATIAVTAPALVPVASVSVSPTSSSLLIGATAQLSATTRDAGNNILTGRVVTWSSANAGIATVSSSGLVRAVSAGTIQVTATSESKSSGATITVSAPAPAPVATVSVAPSSSSLVVGATAQLTATTRDASNNVLTGRVVAWSSTNAGIASVNSSSGLVTAAAAGTATITAASEGKSGTASVTVTIPAPPGSGNEPSGMSLLVDRPFSSLSEGGSWGMSGLSIAQDASAPKSPSGVIRATYPTGFIGGSGPGYAENYHAGNRVLYISYWAKLSSNFWGHLTGVNKQFYEWADGKPIFFFEAHGVGTGSLTPQVVLQGTQSDATFSPNLVSSARIPRGQWYHVEILLTGNTSGSANGVVDWWLDGVHVGSRSGLRYTSGTTSWNEFAFRPVWGGLTDRVPATMTLDLDHLRLSGKN